MEFMDEKIASLQKQAQMARKYNQLKKDEYEEVIEEEEIKELTQEEVTLAIKDGALEQNGENLIFESKSCFEGKVIIPMLKDFFDEYEENDISYCWNKKQVLSVLLSKTEFQEDIDNIDNFKEKAKNFLKEKSMYIEFSDEEKQEYKNYTKYIITSRMPTALDYIYQYIVYIDLETECISMLFTCLEKDKKQWEKIIIGISDLIEINEGDKENNE
ncbi:hypothetical protein psyc5s11_34050 [Clostridium gelidum]|uniref:Uncharacterized protein n=1 Tax=Clostridium gelidum TaxID=704125 RepID=A0ABN6J0Q5_9CLOT|nr:hypothetical protein [Clostridium gelidum]BCZ47338.1 hypothetical protein psyc5s11_34050 [Clostridium gelidum]